MYKLNIPPDRASYSAKQENGIISVKLEGGVSRYRKDLEGVSKIVNVRWFVRDDGYDYLWAFYDTATNSGALPFLIDLILENSNMTEYEAYFSTPLSLSSQSGDSYTLSSKLEVKPLPIDHVGNLAIIEGYAQ